MIGLKPDLEMVSFSSYDFLYAFMYASKFPFFALCAFLCASKFLFSALCVFLCAFLFSALCAFLCASKFQFFAFRGDLKRPLICRLRAV